MSTKNRFRFLASFICLTAIGFYQNCGGGFSTVESNSQALVPQEYIDSDLKSVGITCQDPSVLTPTESRRLTQIELKNSFKMLISPALFQQVEPFLARFTRDEIQKDPRTFASAFDDLQIEALDGISRLLDNLLSTQESHLKSMAGDCSVATPVTAVCVKNFISSFGKKAFRRPLSSAEVDFFNQVYTSTGGGASGFGAIVSALVLSPEFLYHIEAGIPGADTNQQFGLTNYEIASRVSFHLTDAPPDAELMLAAENNAIRTPSILESHVDRLLQSPLGREKVHRFVRYWLTLENLQSLPQAESYLEGLFVYGLKEEMDRELNAFIDHIVYERRGTYSDLLTSKKSFAQTAEMASIYGHELAKSSAERKEMGPHHMGILLRGPVLAHSGYQTHPILRGAFVLRRVLCSEIPNPSAADLLAREGAFVPDPLQDSTAQMTAKQTSQASCMNCHSQINPLGFALEGYDNLGRARQVDKIFDASGKFIAQHPVQISESFSVDPQQRVQISSGPELVSQIAGSITGPACFTRHLHRFYKMKREISNDGCALTPVYRAVKYPDGGILAGIKNSILNSAVDKKRVSNQ